MSAIDCRMAASAIGDSGPPALSWRFLPVGVPMTAVTSSAETAVYAGPEVWGAFIGGAFVEAGDAETFAVMEPATGRQIARVVSGGADLVDRAVAEARRAYGPWRDLAPRERGRLLRLVAAKIRAHVEELAELEAREVGKP